MDARVFIHPTATHDWPAVTRLEMRTGLRAIWTGRRAELLPTDDPPLDWRASAPAHDYTGDGPEAA
jgi:hypothetical protein